MDPVFDPSSLERAAAALRELNKSPYASLVLQLLMKQEEAKRAEKSYFGKAREVEKIKQDGIEKRRNMQQQLETSKQVEDYRDKLERKRFHEHLKEQEEHQRRLRDQQELSVKKQEEMRRETMKFQIQKQTEMEEKKIRLQAKLDSENLRKNFDLYQKRDELRLHEERKTRKELHSIYLQGMRDALSYLMNNQNAVIRVGQYTLGVSMAYFLSKYGLSVFFKQLEARLGQPSLVRETSRKRFFLGSFKKDTFDKVVLNADLERKLRVLSAGLINKKAKSVPLRNFLFYGPPGVNSSIYQFVQDRKDLICQASSPEFGTALCDHIRRRH